MDCRQLPTKRGLRGGDRRCGGGKKGRICRWDHRALARDLEFGPGLRCLWVRAAWGRADERLRAALDQSPARQRLS